MSESDLKMCYRYTITPELVRTGFEPVPLAYQANEVTLGLCTGRLDCKSQRLCAQLGVVSGFDYDSK